MSGNEKKEFGDYQTPLGFCYKVCNYIKESGLANSTRVILEPTCGIGNFLIAASNAFGCRNLVGIEINADYANTAKTEVPSAMLKVDNIFNVSTRPMW